MRCSVAPKGEVDKQVDQNRVMHEERSQAPEGDKGVYSSTGESICKRQSGWAKWPPRAAAGQVQVEQARPGR